ncbi:GNAT family N-acetyltransferase [Clostridium botulinum]|uniref:GNAT family N-acetyltransferase n=1 Tax=Clostridium botulinum TaxID=1491 RepID=UPI0004D3A864|nr:GNAT family N-acetyltransferase [Clostridium botulinum]KEI00399.1 acetyltransferase [Clostridium botulinum C/D str. BKT75002]
MYNLDMLNKSNLNEFSNLNELRFKFNKLNKDFLESYYNLNNVQLLLLRKKLRLLKKGDKYIGYIWLGNKINNVCKINSMYIIESSKLLDEYSYLIDNIDVSYPLIYQCQKNKYNFEILSSLGFKKKNGIMKMSQQLRKIKDIYIPDDISFKKFIRGRDEPIRCFIQNTVFESKDRLPLRIEDIYYDEMQEYYCEDASIFMKKGKAYIGYGQIILRERVPFIVNFGILQEHQNKGYGTLFLKYLLNLLYKKDKCFVKINVNPQNYKALTLYKRIGFNENYEKSRWYLSK